MKSWHIGLAVTTLALVATNCALAQVVNRPYPLADLNPQGDSNPISLSLFNGQCVFVASVNNTTRHLFRTDGTPSGTQVIMLGTTPLRSSSPIYVAGDYLLTYDSTSMWSIASGSWTPTAIGPPLSQFGATIQALHPSLAVTPTGIMYYLGPGSVVRTDGTLSGTRVVPLPQGMYTDIAALGERCVFYRQSSSVFWTSDGTVAGTTSFSVPFTMSTYAESLISMGSYAVCGSAGFLRTDGTQAGTFRLPTPSGSFPYTFAYNGRVYMSYGSMTWVTDGTVSGTQPLSPAFGMRDATILNDRLIIADPNRNLWIIEGTNEPVMLTSAKVHFNALWYLGSTLVVIGDVAYFWGVNSASSSPGLWKTDGTSAGTTLVAAGANGIVSGSSQRDMIALGHRLIFRRNVGTGVEPWAIDVRDPVDCNNNQVNDYEEIALGSAFDANSDDIIDSCQCLADWDGSGATTPQDIFEFLNDWFAGRGDFDHSGVVTPQDVFQFLNAWFLGC